MLLAWKVTSRPVQRFNSALTHETKLLLRQRPVFQGLPASPNVSLCAALYCEAVFAGSERVCRSEFCGELFCFVQMHEIFA